MCRAFPILLLTIVVGADEDGPLRGEPTDDRATWWTSGRQVAAVNSAVVLGITVYGFAVWDWGQSSFSFRNEGWFGSDTSYGGADKVGHAYVGLVATAIAASTYRRWGYERSDAAVLAAGTGMLLTTAIEIGDGFSPGHGFSWEDQVFNLAGVGLEYLRQRYPTFSARVQYRYEWIPSPAFRAGEHDDPFTDYSGTRYLLAFPAGAWWPEQRVLRHLELHLGYATRGFMREDADYWDEARRHAYIGVGLDLGRTLAILRGSRQGPRALEYLQVPYTAWPFPP